MSWDKERIAQLQIPDQKQILTDETGVGQTRKGVECRKRWWHSFFR